MALGADAAESMSVVDRVGNTPLVRLRHLTAHLSERVEVYVKLEYFNPGGSVKDRAARQILLDALERGDLRSGTILLDSTSGNTGVAYAMLGAALGVPVELVMPSNVSQARKAIIEAYGARIRYSDPLEGSDGAIRLAKEVAADDRDGRYWYADQYGNASNPNAHESTTAPELVRDTGGRITHFVAALGTTGTLVGTSRGLRKLVPGVHVTAVEPDAPFHGLEGMKHLESSIVPAIHDPDAADETRFVSTERGWDVAEELAVREGIAGGYSCGAAVAAALDVAAKLDEGVIVTICPDHADRYIQAPATR